jgi:2'-5' RNA ligase
MLPINNANLVRPIKYGFTKVNAYRLLIILCAMSNLLVAMDVPKDNIHLFTAISITQNVRHILTRIQYDLAECFGDIKFSPSSSDNLHITIQNINDFDPNGNRSLDSYVGVIKKGLGNVQKPFRAWAKQMHFDKLWDFAPKLQAGWLTISKNGTIMLRVGRSQSLIRLGQLIDQELSSVNVKTKRNDVSAAYVAHIALGKIEKNKVIEAQSKIAKCDIDINARFKNHKFIIDRFVLYQSNAPAKPRRYTALAEYKFHLGE